MVIVVGFKFEKLVRNLASLALATDFGLVDWQSAGYFVSCGERTGLVWIFGKMEALEKTRIFTVRSEPIRKLDAFEKHHEVPTVVNHRSLEWLDQLTQMQLDAIIGSIYGALRKAYGLKRRQLSVHGPVHRHAVIETPFFNFEASVELDEHNPEQVLWISEINQIRNVEYIVSEEFEFCFPQTAWNLQVSVDNPIDLAEIVDRIEDMNDSGLIVDYDKNLNWCEIQIPDCKAVLRATANSFNVSHATGSTPRQLLLSLIQFQTYLADQIGQFKIHSTSQAGEIG